MPPNSFAKLAFITIFSILAVISPEFEGEPDVLTLTDSTFVKALFRYENVFAIFYAPWDGHSNALLQKLPEIAQSLAEADLTVKLAQIDFTDDNAKKLTKKYEINQYPTIIFFSKPLRYIPIRYKEPQSPSEVTKWLAKKLKPSSVEFKNFEDAQNMIDNNEVLVIYFGPTGAEADENFLNASINPGDVAFVHIYSWTIAHKLGIDFDIIVLFRRFDQEKIILETEGVTAESIKTFVQENKNPLWLPFNRRSLEKISFEGLDTLFLLKNENEEGQKALEILRGISEELKGKLVISVVDVDEQDGKQFLEDLEIEKELISFPMILLVKPSKNNAKYLFEGNLTVGNLLIFVKDFMDNKLKRLLKSQPIPDEKYEEDVRIVVGKNFDEIVLDHDNDVLVEFYAPWDSHFRASAAAYSTFAKKMRNVEGLTIAKMDWTENEVEGLKIQYYPEIRFYPKGKKNKTPLAYNKELTVEGLTDYLREHSESFNKHEIFSSIEL